MKLKIYLMPTIIAILLGACIGLTALLMQAYENIHKVESYANTVNATASSVISIYSQKLEKRHWSENGAVTQTTNLGSGVIITSDGFILTNHHVIQNAQSITVALNDERRLQAKLIGSDPSTDLAVLKIQIDDLPSIKIGNSSKMQIGDRILAIGNPFDIGQTVTSGIISAKGRNSIGLNTYENFLQTDAAINPGNSGGALVNMRGELIGISSAIYSSSGGSQGIGFATPIDDAMAVMQDIITHGEVIRGYLGMEAQRITQNLADNLALPSDYGLLVSDITQSSPAQKAGIEVGDIILEINQTPSTDPYQVQRMIASLKPGTSISLLGLRGRQSYQAKIILEKQPTMQRIVY
ncbi:trypsin-like peptidase domain-containing protein [Marinomonas sp. THO17]|uniref:S1C family serine protease n=1 Tax=Marinomonas sp. THO17 TaxID=3149048 RepID=UPI00336C0B5A